MDDGTSGPHPHVDPGDLTDASDCRSSLAELYGYLDGELTPERRTLIREHLDRCHGCVEAYGFEAELRAVVSSCCRQTELPPGLKERVAQALEVQEDGDYDGEYDGEDRAPQTGAP